MASNPKYGVTYKTTDGKTKTISGINLGTGSYSDEQITAFIGILASITNKEVLSVDVTSASTIPAPEPAPPQRDLITALIIEPAEVTITAGESDTAEILIVTDPEDAAYSLSAPSAPDWVSIYDATLIFSPASTVAAGDYEVTLQADTADDSKESNASVTVKPKPQPVTPALKFISGPSGMSTIDSQGNITVDSYKFFSENAGSYGAMITLKATLKGALNNRTRSISGKFANASTIDISVVGQSYTSYKESVTTISPTINISTGSSVMKAKKGTVSTTATLSVSGSDEYLEEARTITFINGVSSYNIKT